MKPPPPFEDVPNVLNSLSRSALKCCQEKTPDSDINNQRSVTFLSFCRLHQTDERMPKANKRVAIRWDSVEKHGMAKTKAVFAAAANNPNGPKKTTTKKKQGAVLPESEPAPKKEPTPLTYAEQEALSLQTDTLVLGSVLHLAPDLVSKLAILPVLPAARPVQKSGDFNELTRSQFLGPLLRPVERQLLPLRELVSLVPRLDHAPRQRQRLTVEHLLNPLLVTPEDRERERLQSVPDRLPPLLEDARYNAPQVRRAHASQPLPQPRRPEKVQADQSRVHLGLGVEHRRRYSEVDAAVRVELEHDAEYAVLLRRRVGDYPAPDLPLHRDRGAPYGIGVTCVGERE
ncbi:hypothetical protein THAOC_00233 [Thalassiosira oceanica]|uniref:Uncharacterized protein n=1 Tax=Thalassiosira oceanica TaxID=159749 RepID=K3W4G6_THAOC|nr:hypothetical protein THAOC_00233 [Thalassiosira oceanica]|eukprot:EJK77904.1 hypothetical protein THAOC_00233 [Thalassiosira oceanica]